MDYARRERAEALAARCAAGTLRGRARRRYEALLGSHPALRDAHARWQSRLMPLSTALPPQAPPPQLWRRIESALWPRASTAWWERLALWRSLAAAGSVATVMLALLLAAPERAQPPVVVVLQGTGGEAAGINTFVASVSGDGRALVTRPLLPVAMQTGRALELWSVPPEGAPRSLGLISASGATVIARERLPVSLLNGGTAAFAVSLEPPGGSPTGAPTGPVLYVGKLQL